MGARAGLDKASVVQAAARLADAEGLEAVTLVRLAAALGVRPPSLYNHVAGQEGLRRELALHGLRQLAAALVRAAAGKARDSALIAVADAYRSFAHEHPGLYAATLRAPGGEDRDLAVAADEVVATARAVLAGYGLEGEEVLHAARGLRSAVHGFVSLEAEGGFGLPLDLDASFQRLLELFAAGLVVTGRRCGGPDGG